jgi:dynein heavy chain
MCVCVYAYLKRSICIHTYTHTYTQTYYIPDDGPLQSYKDYIAQLPNFDAPEAFGQHGNADIASQIEDTVELLEAILMMQPRVSGGGEVTREDIVDGICKDLLEQVCVCASVCA